MLHDTVSKTQLHVCLFMHPPSALVCSQVCQVSMQQPAGWRSWAHQMAGTQSLAGGLRYLNCCCQQLGEWLPLMYASPLFGAIARCLAPLLVLMSDVCCIECWFVHLWYKLT